MCVCVWIINLLTIWDHGSKKVPSMYYKIFPGRTFNVDACNYNVCVITNSGHCKSMIDIPVHKKEVVEDMVSLRI